MKLKKIVSVFFVCILSTLMLLACGVESNVPANMVVVWSIGGTEEISYLNSITSSFNAENDGVKATFVPMADYNSMLEMFKYGEDLPDIVYIDDEYFKRFASGGHLEKLDELLKNSKLDTSEMWTTSISRYRYNTQNNTSNFNDPLYCVPKDVSPTILFYNEDALVKAGICVISVDEQDLDAFNKNEKADLKGKKKSDYPMLNGVNVEPKGYMRDNYYVFGQGAWLKPSSGEVLVFNNRIPMSWDEIDDLAMLMTKSAQYNPQSPTSYGYYTEWWFNYGWSVGGDCIGDINGEGQWKFTLNDNNPNYKVLKTCAINGKEYAASKENKFSFVSYKDKNFLANNVSEVEKLLASGNIEKFPSTLEAFTRFTALSRPTSVNDSKGIEVAPRPSLVSDNTAALGKFNLGAELAMYVGYASQATSIKSTINWNFAPLPVYKTYETDGVTVKQIGSRSGHSKSTGFAISTKSAKKDLAIKFLEYIAGDVGQKLMAKSHYYLPNTQRVALSDYMQVGSKNYGQVITETQFQNPGDWWYMPERSWIANWSQSLNQNAKSVRNGTLSLSEYFSTACVKTDEALKLFWKK